MANPGPARSPDISVIHHRRYCCTLRKFMPRTRPDANRAFSTHFNVCAYALDDLNGTSAQRPAQSRRQPTILSHEHR